MTKASRPFHIPSRAREVYDLSGAGDTAIALLTLALASGASAIEAAEISNHASSVVVGKLGTATLTPDELIESFRDTEKMDSRKPARQKAIFLDRDGTLMKDVGYCSRPAEVELLQGVNELLPKAEKRRALSSLS